MAWAPAPNKSNSTLSVLTPEQRRHNPRSRNPRRMPVHCQERARKTLLVAKAHGQRHLLDRPPGAAQQVDGPARGAPRSSAPAASVPSSCSCRCSVRLDMLSSAARASAVAASPARERSSSRTRWPSSRSRRYCSTVSGRARLSMVRSARSSRCSGRREVALVEADSSPRRASKCSLAGEHQRIGVAVRRRGKRKVALRSEMRESMAQQA